MRDTSQSNTYFLHGDRQGSIEAITNAQGAVVQTRSFDSFGKMKSSGSSISIHGYTGEEFDDESDLVNLNARLYDPALARFVSADPITGVGGGSQAMNPYTYGLNNPITWSDQSGLSPEILAVSLGPAPDSYYHVLTSAGEFKIGFVIETEDFHVVGAAHIGATATGTAHAAQGAGAAAATSAGSLEDIVQIADQAAQELGTAGATGGTSGAAVGAGAADGAAIAGTGGGAAGAAGAGGHLALADVVGPGIGVALFVFTVVDILTSGVTIPVAGGAQATGAAVERGAVTANSLTNHLVDRLQTVAEGARDAASHWAASVDVNPDGALMTTLNAVNGFASNSASYGLGGWLQDQLGLGGILDQNAISYQLGSVTPVPLPGGIAAGIIRNAGEEMQVLNTLRRLAGNLKNPLSRIAKHHAWPKYLGGPAKQELVPLAKKVHEAFHSGLDKILPRQWGKAYYDGLSEAAKSQALQDLVDYTRAFDKKHGTEILEALLKALGDGS